MSRRTEPEWRILVTAKAPVPGLAKTRLAAAVGDRLAAELAAAALLDTLAVAAETVGARRCVLALAGELSDAVRVPEIVRALRDWTVLSQRGESFGARLAAAHADAGPGPLVQIGMDTPQVTPTLLTEVFDGLAEAEAVLGPATDGGWWALALRDPVAAAALVDVPMSTPTTHAHTWVALRARGLTVSGAAYLRDVDDAEDAAAVARGAPHTRFAQAWATVTAGSG